jgi:hypothetical protein
VFGLGGGDRLSSRRFHRFEDQRNHLDLSRVDVGAVNRSALSGSQGPSRERAGDTHQLAGLLQSRGEMIKSIIFCTTFVALGIGGIDHLSRRASRCAFAAG